MTRLIFNGKYLNINGLVLSKPTSSGYQVELIITIGPDIISETGSFSVNGDEKISLTGTANDTDSVFVNYQLGDVTTWSNTSSSFIILVDGYPLENPDVLNSYDGSFSTLELVLTSGGQT